MSTDRDCREVRGELRTAFACVIEAHPHGETRIVSATRCDTKGNESADSVAVEVTHTCGRDLVMVAREPGHMAGPRRGVSFDGRLVAVSFAPNGSLLRAAMVEGRCLTVGATRIDRPAATLSGKVLSLPGGIATSILGERDAAVEVDISVPVETVGRMMTIQHHDGMRSAWTIRKVEPLEGSRSRVTLDRPARVGIGRLGSVSEDGRIIAAITGLDHAAQAEGCAGLWVIVHGQWRRIVSRLEGAEPKFVLDMPLAEPDAFVGAPFVVTCVGPGDPVTIPQAIYWERQLP